MEYRLDPSPESPTCPNTLHTIDGAVGPTKLGRLAYRACLTAHIHLAVSDERLLQTRLNSPQKDCQLIDRRSRFDSQIKPSRRNNLSADCLVVLAIDWPILSCLNRRVTCNQLSQLKLRIIPNRRECLVDAALKRSRVFLEPESCQKLGKKEKFLGMLLRKLG